MSVPKDKNNVIYILYLLHGIALIMPWHTTKEAFAYFHISIEDKTKSEYFSDYFSFPSMMTRVVFMAINLFLPKSFGTLSSRMLFSIAMDALVLAFVVLLMFSDTKQMSGVLSWMALGSNVVMSMFGGIYLSSAFGSVSIMPMKYTAVLCIGMNLEFVFVIVCNILFNANESNPKWMAFLFFSTTIILSIFCIVLEITSKSNKFREYYQELADYSTRAEEKDIIGNRYLYVFTQTYEQLLDTFLAFFVSFTVFPRIVRDIESSNYWISDQYIFSGVSLFIGETFNLIGAITAQYSHYLTPESLIAFTSARLLMIPMTLFFNFHPKVPKSIVRTLPVLLKNDLLFWSGGVFGGFTGGYLWTLSMMYATQQVRPQYAHIVGMMSSLIFILAMLFGSYFGVVLQNIV